MQRKNKYETPRQKTQIEKDKAERVYIRRHGN